MQGLPGESQQQSIANTEPNPPGTGQSSGGTPTGEQRSAGQTGGSGQQQSSEVFDEARARQTIEHLRGFETEAKQAKRELAAAHAELQKLKDADLSETEKLRKQIESLTQQAELAERQRRDVTVRAAIEREARKLEIVDEDAAYRLLDPQQLDFDEDGNPKNIKPLLEKLLEARPYLKANSQEAGARIPPTQRSNGTPNQRDRVEQEAQRLQASGRYIPL